MSEKQLIYRSIAVENSAETALQVIERASVFNLSRRITGALLVYDSTFVQVLEGEASEVDNLMGRIFRDPRHREVKVLFDFPTSVRMWPSWQMSVIAPTPSNLPILERFDVGPGRQSLAELDPILVRALLIELSERARNRAAESNSGVH